MIEALIREHLASQLGVPVFLEQKVRQGKYVVFEKVGGSRSNYLSSSIFAFQSYGDSLFQASELNEAVKEALDSLVALPEVAFVRYNSDSNFTDTSIKKYRYQAVYEIKHY